MQKHFAGVSALLISFQVLDYCIVLVKTTLQMRKEE